MSQALVTGKVSEATFKRGSKYLFMNDLRQVGQSEFSPNWGFKSPGLGPSKSQAVIADFSAGAA